FAYAIHSDIGDKSSGAKINGKFSALDAKLKNADIVEIITKKDAHPSSKWLEYSHTTLAKRHIRSYLNEHNTSIFAKFFK
ncbi:MAG: TGS domain-containing protein, partial [Candidatus Paceibacterota bacterium]